LVLVLGGSVDFSFNVTSRDFLVATLVYFTIEGFDFLNRDCREELQIIFEHGREFSHVNLLEHVLLCEDGVQLLAKHDTLLASEHLESF